MKLHRGSQLELHASRTSTNKCIIAAELHWEDNRDACTVAGAPTNWLDDNLRLLLLLLLHGEKLFQQLVAVGEGSLRHHAHAAVHDGKLAIEGRRVKS